MAKAFKSDLSGELIDGTPVKMTITFADERKTYILDISDSEGLELAAKGREQKMRGRLTDEQREQRG